ncbi:MAG: oxidative damage protection protein [Gammaproteobacteria bacterium]|nr:oxidative damage protection protein [Gammaproteobacteria bacterium]MCD8543019.1 oxidative damage protection protein [Gammaproteobacteria bacterium]
MNKMVFCKKLQQELEGLTSPPYPGELGKRIFSDISALAWKQWLNHQTMLINEYRLNMLDSKARAFLASEMEKYFFGAGSEKPTGYTPPLSSSETVT